MNIILTSMKRSLLILRLALPLLSVPFLAKAQFSKGDIFIGGNASAGYNRQLENGPDTKQHGSRFSISPNAAVFVSPRFALGGALSVYRSHNQNSSYDAYSRIYGVGVLGRYFLLAKEKFSIALTGTVGFNRTINKIKYSYSDASTGKSYSLVAAIRPTFLFFPSPRWGFEASVGTVSYSHGQSLSQDSKADNFNAGYGNFTLGVAYYFRKS